MINLPVFLNCVDIDEVILEINGVEYLPQQLLSSFFSRTTITYWDNSNV